MGVVTDSSTGRQMSSAVVTVEGTPNGAITDTAGNYTISNIPPGIITLQVRKLGYKPITRSGFRVSAATTHVVSFSIVQVALIRSDVVATGRTVFSVDIVSANGVWLHGISSSQPHDYSGRGLQLIPWLIPSLFPNKEIVLYLPRTLPIRR